MKTIGWIGLSDESLSAAQALRKDGYIVVAFDFDDQNRRLASNLGIVTTSSVQAVALHLPSPKVVWLSGISKAERKKTLKILEGILEPGDAVFERKPASPKTRTSGKGD